MHKIALISGDGIGPEISEAVKKIVAESGAKIEWEEVLLGEIAYKQLGDYLPQESIDKIRQMKIALKGPLTTPVGGGFKSINVTLRKEFNLYANLRPVRNLPNVKSVRNDIDLVVVRENTEDLYIGNERKVDDDTVEAIKLITRQASERIVKFAFDYAVDRGRKKVSAVHKANILKMSDGLFLESARKIAANYPSIEFNDVIVDNMCMQMVMYPEKYDVLVMPNLYGDILSDLAAGLIGGLGLAPSANLGEDFAIFEAVHGSAPNIAGQNAANPIALLLSAVMMLEYIGEAEAGARIKTAVNKALANAEILTPDLGGKGTTTSLTEEICKHLA